MELRQVALAIWGMGAVVAEAEPHPHPLALFYLIPFFFLTQPKQKNLKLHGQQIKTKEVCYESLRYFSGPVYFTNNNSDGDFVIRLVASRYLWKTTSSHCHVERGTSRHLHNTSQFSRITAVCF